ncbi:MAG: NADH-quinone oxidoreductase subunit K [Deltaproteobacteria bacterium]|jgi:NADH:ubiquinone oxidoreductase subunit K|nr:NADH-quinone oxidoreductase subunit K [Deltaproteobacteria bacterium]MBW2501193.1 NADH-quinone oxidoreductase subunit K [Deltaproteobacteria bacterium]
MLQAIGSSGWIVIGAIALFWVSMLGLLWRRSLIGMLVGLLFGWVSVGVAALGFLGLQSELSERASGGVLVLCAVVLGALQVAVGLGIVVARIERRGSLDADDAGLLEG